MGFSRAGSNPARSEELPFIYVTAGATFGVAEKAINTINIGEYDFPKLFVDNIYDYRSHHLQMHIKYSRYAYICSLTFKMLLFFVLNISDINLDYNQLLELSITII